MNRRANRWRTCLHESAHCVVARALDLWDCTTAARVSDDGRGVAELPHGLTPFADAVATAAGAHGAKLPFDSPARRRRPPLPPLETAEGIRARAVRKTEAEIAEKSHNRAMATGTDAETVARFCISLHPGAPQEWVAAYARVHDAARCAVWAHRDEIRRVAIRLFHRGAATLKGDPQDDEAFASGAVAAGATQQAG